MKQGRFKVIDVPLLFKLWADETMRREEIASRLGCSHAHLARAVKTYGLPPRARKPPPVVPNDPTPDEIAARARECRERHMEQRRREQPCNT